MITFDIEQDILKINFDNISPGERYKSGKLRLKKYTENIEIKTSVRKSLKEIVFT